MRVKSYKSGLIRILASERIENQSMRFFMYNWAGDGFVWLHMFEEGMTIPPELEIIAFQGGLYAVATDIDQKTDQELMNTEMDRFLSENGI